MLCLKVNTAESEAYCWERKRNRICEWEFNESRNLRFYMRKITKACDKRVLRNWDLMVLCKFLSYIRITRTADMNKLLQKRPCLGPAKKKFSMLFIKHKAMMGCLRGREVSMVPRIRKLPRDIGECGPENSDRIAQYTHCMGDWQSGQNDEKKNNCSYGGSNSCSSALILSLYKVIPAQCRLHILKHKFALF